MKVIFPGYVYQLQGFDDPNSTQVIQFIQKQKKAEDSDELVTVHGGTTNEEVLSMLIDRLYFLQTKAPCRENAIVITKLEESLMWLNKRTRDRKSRGVEGTAAK